MLMKLIEDKHTKRKGILYSCVRLREAWRAAIQGVAKSRTRLSDWTELKVKGVRKERFRKSKRPALYRNRSPLMRREGAAVILASCCTNLRNKWVYIVMHVESYCLRGLFFSKVVQSSYLLNGWDKEFWRWEEAGPAWSWVKST